MLPDLSKNAKTAKLSFLKASNPDPIALKFPRVFDSLIGRVACPPLKIELCQDVVPSSSGAHCQIAEAYLQPLKDEIQEQIDAGIFELVKETPTRKLLAASRRRRPKERYEQGDTLRQLAMPQPVLHLALQSRGNTLGEDPFPPQREKLVCCLRRQQRLPPGSS